MALSIGGTALAEPMAENGCTEGRVFVGNQERNLSGSMTEDLFAWKRTWAVTWKGVTGAQVSAIETEIAKTPPLVFVPYHGGSFNVMVRRFEKTPQYLAAGTFYDASLALEEA